MKNQIMDVVLVSDAKNSELRRITETAVASAGNSVNIIVVESNSSVSYDGALTINPSTSFNYNRFLNIGARHGTSDYVFFGNNDLIFFNNWEKNIISEMEKHSVISASPLSPYNLSDVKLSSESLYGHEIIRRFCGWAFVWKRSFFEKVGGLNEDFRFWCSDNAAIEQLIEQNEAHILVPSSLVQHMGNLTSRYLDPSILHSYTIEEVEKFNKKYNVNLWSLPHLKNFHKRNNP
jgi:hypothetical protein